MQQRWPEPSATVGGKGGTRQDSRAAAQSWALPSSVCSGWASILGQGPEAQGSQHDRQESQARPTGLGQGRMCTGSEIRGTSCWSV